MYIFGLEIRRDTRPKEITLLICSHCSRQCVINVNDVRTPYYCTSCR